MEHWQSEKVYLEIENNVLPVEPSKGYEIYFSDYDRTDQTEAGTTVREVTRLNIPSISVVFQCDAEMLKEMRSYKNKPSVTVKYYDVTSASEDQLSTDSMYVTNYKEVMLADTNDGGIWKVTFDLEDLGDV